MVPEFGVPLPGISREQEKWALCMTYGPMSDGVSDGGGGRLIKVGVGMMAKLATVRFLIVRAFTIKSE